MAVIEDPICVISEGHCVAARLRTFDAERLRECLVALRSFARAAQPWEAHGGAWKGLALVTNAEGVESARSSCPGEREPQETAALAVAPYLRDALRAAPGRVVFARLMFLEPGGHVPDHTDGWHSLGTGLVRMQLGIDVGSGAGLRLAGRDVGIQDGELWFTDVSQTHSVANASSRARVNVLADVEITEAFVEAMGDWVRRDEVFVARRAFLTEAELRGFERAVVVPGEVGALMGGAGPASIGVEGGAPWLRFDGGRRVLLRAESSDILNVVGSPPGLAIVYRRSGDPRAPQVRLVLRGGRYGCTAEPGHVFDLAVGE
jgi:Aspartyl/Asparaginyl beta-hydroxylase